MAYTTIDKPSDYFNTKTYTGTGSELAITGVNFRPDWIWFKQRNAVRSHALVDSVRGRNKVVFSDLSNAEETSASATNDLVSFDSDGFTVGTTSVSGSFNTSSGTHVAWCWKASGSTASNTDGSITTTVSVNQTAGFSIIQYAGNSTNSTIGHGLGSSPEFIIFKERDGTESWRVHSIYTPNNSSNTLALNTTSGAFSQTNWISAISSSTISIGTDSSFNTSGNNYIAYAFAPKKGYSKFGSYTGNGNADGTFVYTGFKPAIVWTKRTDSTSAWRCVDNKRNPANKGDKYFDLNTNAAEGTAEQFDMLSNGFKLRNTATQSNASGGTFIYLAFAENPFVTSTGIPTTAR